MRFTAQIAVQALRLLNSLSRRIVSFAVKYRLYDALLYAPTELLPEAVIRSQAFKCSDLGCSFRTEISAHFRTWMHSKTDRLSCAEWLLDNKITSYKFVDALGVRRPAVYQVGVPFREVEFRDRVVVKPEDGYYSNGVFLIYDATRQFDMRKKQNLSSLTEVQARIKDALDKGLVEKDLWFVEELILGDERPVHDLKFYSFYGSTPLALEVSRDDRGLRYRWWNRELQVVDAGKYACSDLQAPGPLLEHFELADRISQKIPSPFMRIDFHWSGELVFGEFGNLVGGFSGFRIPWDRSLGHEFIRARGRLFQDLRSGKSFPEFDDVQRDERP
jgi:hypothetical protein